MSRTITIEHNGKSYRGELGRIKSTFLGEEDHGCLTVMLQVEWGSSAIGVGGYALDSYDKAQDRRVPTAFGLDHIVQIMATVGVRKWEDLPGQPVIVLFDADRGMAAGVASAMDDRVLIFAEHAAEWIAAGVDA